MKKVLAAVALVKAKMKGVKKDAENPYFDSKYADLNAHLNEVEPLLEQQGLMLIQPCSVRTDGKQVVKSVIIHVESGEHLESELELLMEKKDMQKLGSAVTYARRYTLGSLLSMKAEDDDGNSSSNDNRKAVKKSKKKAKPGADEDEF